MTESVREPARRPDGVKSWIFFHSWGSLKMWKKLKARMGPGLYPTVALAGIVTFFLGTMGLASWVSGWRLLAAVRPGYIPMAVDTALLFMAFGAILPLLARNPNPRTRRSVTVVAGLASVYGLLKFIEYFVGADLTFEGLLFPVTERLGAFPLGRMSPFSGFLFFLSGAALLLKIRGGERHRTIEAAGGLGLLVTVGGFVATTGYLFGTPLLYGGSAVPLAATTAAAFLSLGIGLTILAGPGSFVLRGLSGSSASARLLRVILPLVVSAILLQGLLHAALIETLHINDALFSALLALFSIFVFSLAIVRSAQGIFRSARRAEIERDRAEAELRESEERYRSLFEDNHAVMLIINPGDGAIVDANASAAAYYGWGRDELRRLNISRINTLSIPEVQAEMDRARRDERRHFFFRHRRADGSVRDVEVYSGPITLKSRPLLYSIVHDVSERKRMERELVRAHDFHLRLLNDAPALIWRAGQDAKCDWFNATWLNFTGRTMGQEMGDGWVDGVHADDLNHCLKIYLDAFRARRPFDMEYRLRRADGEYRWIADYGIPFRSEAEEFAGYIGYCFDVTERRLAEESLRQLVEQKEILMKELQHRVKNSLAVVSSLLGLEMAELSDAGAKKAFADARSRIRSVASIYERLYLSGKLDRVDLGVYIRDLSESLFKTYAPESGKIRLRAGFDDISLDTKRAVPLGLIVNELITNALKYAYPEGAAGEIRVELRKSGETVTLDVGDDGAGLPEGFEPKAGGGMGLNLVRMLTEQIDGRLDFRKGKGTGFTVRFDL
jgi:PAS domain S-box-containing protein